MTKADISRLMATKMRFLRSVEGKTKRKIIKKKKIGENSNINTLEGK
jgi:hypothetical protein